MALTPLDGRYAHFVAPLLEHLSEDALIRKRIAVEIAWFLALSREPSVTGLPAVGDGEAAALEAWAANLSDADLAAVRQIERTIKHDVKAVEYFVKRRVADSGLAQYVEYVHFGCTSEDINNVSYALMLRGGFAVWMAAAEKLTGQVAELAREHKALAMLSHTHGQAASCTTLGKELAVFVYRWRRQLSQMRQAEYLGKFNGAVGCFNAHAVAYPEAPWIDISRRFVAGFGLVYNPLTTQIEPHDYMAELFNIVMRFNSILLDFVRDMWLYISYGYLKQRLVPGEVGSSTMPHKINPIEFENAEANIGIANALFDHLAQKLLVSRLQRDLSDSSALRSIATAAGHALVAVAMASQAVTRIAPDEAAIARDLDSGWDTLAEALQTLMRRYGFEEPYERIKELTRGQEVGREKLRTYIDGMDLPAEAKARLKALTPAGYVGLASELVDRFLE